MFSAQKEGEIPYGFQVCRDCQETFVSLYGYDGPDKCWRCGNDDWVYYFTQELERAV